MPPSPSGFATFVDKTRPTAATLLETTNPCWGRQGLQKVAPHQCRPLNPLGCPTKRTPVGGGGEFDISQAKSNQISVAIPKATPSGVSFRRRRNVETRNPLGGQGRPQSVLTSSPRRGDCFLWGQPLAKQGALW